MGALDFPLAHCIRILYLLTPYLQESGTCLSAVCLTSVRPEPNFLSCHDRVEPRKPSTDSFSQFFALPRLAEDCAMALFCRCWHSILKMPSRELLAAMETTLKKYSFCVACSKPGKVSETVRLRLRVREESDHAKNLRTVQPYNNHLCETVTVSVTDLIEWPGLALTSSTCFEAPAQTHGPGNKEVTA